MKAITVLLVLTLSLSSILTLHSTSAEYNQQVDMGNLTLLAQKASLKTDSSEKQNDNKGDKYSHYEKKEDHKHDGDSKKDNEDKKHTNDTSKNPNHGH